MQSILEKRTQLATAIRGLKQEFVGIDGIIDEVHDLVLPWWIFPDHQVRPAVINLWGMTGSGKTALVRRLAELLGHEHALLHFDMGSYGQSSSFLKYDLIRHLRHFDERNPIIVLDEFQFARSLDENGREKNNRSLRAIWDLLDSGVLLAEPSMPDFRTKEANKLLKLLDRCLSLGVTMRQGVIIDGEEVIADVFRNYEFGYAENPQEEKLDPAQYFLAEHFLNGLVDLIHWRLDTERDAEDYIRQLNDLADLRQAVDEAIKQREMMIRLDLSRSLLFVIGNLDEAFYMSGNINPDIEADEFHANSRKITIAEVKKSLQKRFRNEQIARLGNNHLIYHAFSRAHYQEFIRLHLGYLNASLQARFGFSASFTPAVEQLIYAEGVFPTQGVRPVMSTIRNLIESNFSKLLLRITERDLPVRELRMDYDDDQLDVRLLDATGAELEQVRIALRLKVHSLRRSRNDDVQALVGVHEAGHATAAIFLAGLLPEYIVSRTVDSESNGFTLIQLPEEILSYRLLRERICILLGGYVAERLVFGAEDLSAGASEDIVRLTRLAHQAIRDFGMDSDPISRHIHVYGGNSYRGTFHDALEEQTDDLVRGCLAETERCLAEHQRFLLELGQRLSEVSRVDKPDIKTALAAYCRETGREMPRLVTRDQYFNYRERLEGAMVAVKF
jgi:cell division protease FtsH